MFYSVKPFGLGRFAAMVCANVPTVRLPGTLMMDLFALITVHNLRNVGELNLN